MKRFLFVYTVKPGTRIPKTTHLRFPGEKAEIEIRPIFEKPDNSTSVQTGLEIRGKVEDLDFHSAAKQSRLRAEGIASFITFTNGAGLPLLQEELGYEVTEGVSARDFMQVTKMPLVMPSQRNFSIETFVAAVRSYFDISDQNRRERVGRALRWYRNGVISSDTFEKFTSFWLGLESLNPILQDMLGVLDDPTYCPHCGRSFVSTPTMSGVRKFVEEYLPELVKDYSEVRKIRIDLMHAKTRLDQLLERARTATSTAQSILWRGIARFLAISQSEPEPKTVNLAVPVRMLIEAKLEGGESASLGVGGSDPQAEVTHLTVSCKTSPESVSYYVNTKISMKVNSGIRVSQYTLTLIGPEEMKITFGPPGLEPGAGG